MRAMHLRQYLTAAVTLGLTLLIAGALGLGAAIQQGTVEPPPLDVQHGMIRIVAYRTHYPACPPYTQCPPQSVAPPQEYYVVWSIAQTATADQPYHRTTRRILVMLLPTR